jgi:hypothetical protein
MSDLNVGNINATNVGTDTVTNKAGVPVMSFDATGGVSFTSGAGLSVWATSTRPSSPSIGAYGFNTDTDAFEIYNGTYWLQYEPKSPITSAGLVMHLDAGNLDSYGGAGTTWADLTGNGYNGIVRGTNRWSSLNGGIFDFPNSDQISDWIEMPEAALNSVGGAWTLETWMQVRDAVTGNRYFHSMATSSNNNLNIYQQTTSNIGVYQGSVSFPYDSNGEWMQFTTVRSGTSSGVMYKNATNATNTNLNSISSAQGWALNQEQDTVKGSFDAGQSFRGAFAIVRLYNRALTASEIKTNYDNQKARFGL